MPALGILLLLPDKNRTATQRDYLSPLKKWAGVAIILGSSLFWLVQKQQESSEWAEWRAQGNALQQQFGQLHMHSEEQLDSQRRQLDRFIDKSLRLWQQLWLRPKALRRNGDCFFTTVAAFFIAFNHIQYQQYHQQSKMQPAYGNPRRMQYIQQLYTQLKTALPQILERNSGFKQVYNDWLMGYFSQQHGSLFHNLSRFLVAIRMQAPIYYANHGHLPAQLQQLKYLSIPQQRGFSIRMDNSALHIEFDQNQVDISGNTLVFGMYFRTWQRNSKIREHLELRRIGGNLPDKYLTNHSVFKDWLIFYNSSE